VTTGSDRSPCSFSELRCRRRLWPCRVCHFPGPTAGASPGCGRTGGEDAHPTGSPLIIGPLIARDRRQLAQGIGCRRAETRRCSSGPSGATPVSSTSEGLRRLGISEEIADPLGGLVGPRRNRTFSTAGPMRQPRRSRPAHSVPPTAEGLAHLVRRSAATLCALGSPLSIHLMNTTTSLSRGHALAGLAICEARCKKWTVYSWGTWENPTHSGGRGAAIDRVAKQTLPKVRVEGTEMDGGRHTDRTEFPAARLLMLIAQDGTGDRTSPTSNCGRFCSSHWARADAACASRGRGRRKPTRVLKMMEQLAPVATWARQAGSN